MFVISVKETGSNATRYWKQNGEQIAGNLNGATFYHTFHNAKNAVEDIPRKYTVQIMQLVPYVEPASASAVCLTEDQSQH